MQAFGYGMQILTVMTNMMYHNIRLPSLGVGLYIEYIHTFKILIIELPK